MILTCPECQKQFNVPANKIGAGGRTVRCGACKHTWYVDAGEENTEELENIDIDETLDQFREEEGAFDAGQDVKRAKTFESALSREMGGDRKRANRKKENSSEQNQIFSALMGIVAVLVLLVISLPFSSTVMNIWPASQSFYKIIGIDIPQIGENLVFDRVEVRANAESLEVLGFVINLAKSTETVPNVNVSVLTKEGERELETFTLPFTEIEGEASRPFRKSFKLTEATTESVSNINLKFTY